MCVTKRDWVTHPATAMAAGLSLGLLIAACAQATHPAQAASEESFEQILPQPQFGVSKFYDEPNNVVCWIVHTHRGTSISCLPLATPKNVGIESIPPTPHRKKWGA